MLLSGRKDLSVPSIHLLLILLLTAAIYLPFLGDMAWRGNEPLRVIVAQAMLETGDYLQPVFHGTPYFLKPPLVNWLIAASAATFGSLNEWTSRLPSVVLMFLLGVSLYFLTATWLKRDGRLFAALATLSTAGLILKGRTAEVDSLFIFLVVFILLLWINGYVRQWNPVILWGVSLFLLGISFLTKGPQAPAYFYSTVFAFLFFRKKTSFFFSRAHLFGLLIFAGVLVVYVSSVLRSITLNDYIDLWIAQITSRGSTGKNSFLGHLFQYPITIFLAFMPWVLFVFPAFFMRDLRAGIVRLLKNELVVYSLIMIVVNFPVYWLLPSARDRYFLPAGPFIVIINAAFFELYIDSAETMPQLRIFFERTLKVLSWTAVLAVVLIFSIGLYKGLALTLLLGLTGAGLASLAVYIIYRIRSVPLRYFPVVTAFLVGLYFPLFAGMNAQYDSMQENNPKKIASEINGILPDNIVVVYELGYKRFQSVTCYLNKKVIMLDGFDKLPTRNAANTYFIFDSDFVSDTGDNPRKTLPPENAWEEIYSKYFRKSKGTLIVGRLREGSE
ncbi:MAG: glycosyltransferase family 39 protein [Nitrospirae bacterium]|nr:glycosyltransferase family 39 protein [Nitrospirota bacterium]